MAIHPITKLSLLSGGPTSSVRGCKALIPCCWRAAHKRRTVSQPARLSGARKSTSGARRGIHRRSAQPDFRAAQDDVVGEPLAADFQHAIFIARSPATESDGFHTIKRRRTAGRSLSSVNGNAVPAEKNWPLTMQMSPGEPLLRRQLSAFKE
jgi:hypothetical protein